MQYKVGTVTTNGTNQVTGSGTAWLTNAAIGDLFWIQGQNAPYYIGNVNSDVLITLTSVFAGPSLAGQNYVIARSFTANQKFPYPESTDIDTHTIVKRAMTMLDTMVGAAIGAAGQANRVVFTDANGNLSTNANLAYAGAAGLTFGSSSTNGTEFDLNNTTGHNFAVLSTGSAWGVVAERSKFVIFDVTSGGSIVAMDGAGVAINKAVTTTAAGNNLFASSSTAAASGSYLRYGNAFFGQESSAGGSVMTGGAANAAVFGTYGNVALQVAINNAEVARFDGAGGNFVIGRTSAGGYGDGGSPKISEVHGGSGYGLNVLSSTATADGSTLGVITWGTSGASGTKRGVTIAATLDGSAAIDAGAYWSVFNNNGGTLLERLRVTKPGFTKHSDTGTFVGPTGTYHEFSSSAASDTRVIYVRNTSAGPHGIDINYSAAAPNDTAHDFLNLTDSSATRGRWAGNGGIYNFSANNVNLSDGSIKVGMAPAPDYCDFIERASTLLKVGAYEDDPARRVHTMFDSREVEQLDASLISPWQHTPLLLLKGLSEHEIQMRHLGASGALLRRMKVVEQRLGIS